MKKPTRKASQVAAEKRREEADQFGKTLIRHTADSAKAVAALQERWGGSAPEVLRKAAIEMAGQGNLVPATPKPLNPNRRKRAFGTAK